MPHALCSMFTQPHWGASQFTTVHIHTQSDLLLNGQAIPGCLSSDEEGLRRKVAAYEVKGFGTLCTISDPALCNLMNGRFSELPSKVAPDTYMYKHKP